MEQRELWPNLEPAKNLGFVLYGGTAVALRYGHRQSVDFDFFSDKPLDQKLLSQKFPFIADAHDVRPSPNTLNFDVPPKKPGGRFVKISFFGGIKWGRVGDPEVTNDGILQVASPEDLLLTPV